MSLYAGVYVEDAVYNIDKEYDYKVPDSLAPQLQRGMRVIVPFGRGNRKRQAMVVRISDTCRCEKPKPIAALIDEKPVAGDEEIELAVWMKGRYFCTFFDAIRTILPAGVNIKVETLYSVIDQSYAAENEDERFILEKILGGGNSLSDRDFADFTACQLKALDRLVCEGVCSKQFSADRNVKDYSVKVAELAAERFEVEEYISMLPSKASKQAAVLNALLAEGSMTLKEIEYMTGASPSTVTALKKKGLVRIYEEEGFRSPLKHLTEQSDCNKLQLTPHQQAVFDKILSQFNEKRPSAALLHGVTGSGKTEIYLELIEKAAQNGDGVIVLFPEIALTSQMVGKFYNRFGQRVAVINSRLSLGERSDEWKRIKNGLADIVIGTRSAVFAPLKKIGLIIIDEEQEHTYKSESVPKYHAKDIARYRCARHGAMMLLGSATPSLESYYSAASGKYTLYKLTERYKGMQLPEVDVVDMKGELAKGNTTYISEALRGEIEKNLNAGEQVILFLNRRGYNTFVSCRSCGHVIVCPRCSVSLTYHAINGRLMCHYCGYSCEQPKCCPNCGGAYVRYSGIGTQKLQQQLEDMFPGIAVLRMDADTTTGKMSHQNMLESFKSGGYNVLLGTQMVTKGLDFPNVTLVGIINADALLNLNSYLANEQAFSMLAQVIGRSGRGDIKGRAIIQTSQPSHHVIKLAVMQDYESFYRGEIVLRQQLRYPPFCDVCIIIFTGVIEDEVERASRSFMQSLERAAKKPSAPAMTAYGPSQAGIYKLNNKYRYRIFVKCRADKAFKEMMDGLIKDYLADKANKNVGISVDINPYVNI